MTAATQMALAADLSEVVLPSPETGRAVVKV